MAETETILVIDDEPIMQEILGDFLREEGYKVDVAGSGEEGLELAREKLYDCAIVDLMMPGIDGIETTQRIKEIDSTLPVIMITAFASVESAVDAMKKGAREYITKPFKNDEVLLVLKNAIERRQLEIEVQNLRQALREKYRFENIVGKNRKMQEIYRLIGQAAPARSTILVQGESGTGKELVAKAIHANSQRAEGPFIIVNSGSIPSELLESNLFGHVKGAFTGAVRSRKGLFEAAHGGSIFFDEIGNVALEVQAKLLRVLQEREFMRVGSVDTVSVDVRVIVATNVDLRTMVQQGTFREDLYYRLNVITINLPPLRERTDDVPLLAQHFLDKYAQENNRNDLWLTDEALLEMRGYRWPGNVRELENAIERAVVLVSPAGQIEASLIREYIEPKPLRTEASFDSIGNKPMKEMVLDYQRRIILTALEETGWVQKDAAELLAMKPTTLNEMIKRCGIRETIREKAS